MWIFRAVVFRFQGILHGLVNCIKLFSHILIHKPIKYISGLLGILSIAAIYFLIIRKIVLDDAISTTLIASQSCHNNSTSRHFVFPHLEKSSERRCYPLLINFAHRCCRRGQKNNCLTGLQHGIQQCLMFNKRILDNNPNFFNRNKNILERKRGAGYWLWKPYIIFQELYLARDGDVIIYSDALVDFVANISYLIKLTEKEDIIVFKMTGFKESAWTKRDTFILLDVDKPEYTDTWTSLASYIVLKKSFTSMAFVSEWLTYAQDRRAITDDDNVLDSINYHDFRDHRHDQSILSLLAKKWNLTLYPDPSQWGEMHKRPYPTIFNHHRSDAIF